MIAGQRRLLACRAIAAEDGAAEPVPCAILEDGDDAKAIEASLAENIARLPMDEIDQYEAFAAILAQGRSVADIAKADLAAAASHLSQPVPSSPSRPLPGSQFLKMCTVLSAIEPLLNKS